MKLRNPVVTLPLRVVMEAVAPPDHIQTVADYQRYLINLFYEESAPEKAAPSPTISLVEPKRPPGRPRKESQPSEGDTSEKAPLPKKLLEDLQKYPEAYENGKGSPSMEYLHADQSGLSGDEYRLTNGIIASLAGGIVAGLRNE